MVFHTVQAILNFLDERRPVCSCGAELPTELHYWGPHSEGLDFPDVHLATNDRPDVPNPTGERRMWYYVTCTECGYGWSVWKIFGGLAKFSREPPGEHDLDGYRINK